MTQNQKNLIHFIASYRVRYGTSPTLQEMVKGIGVSDHKSVSGIISTLIKQGYLEKGKPKVRSILLTDKALEFLNMPLFRQQQLKEFDLPYRQLVQLEMGSTPTLSAPDFLGYGDQTIETDGTILGRYLATIVETVVSRVVDKNSSSTYLGETIPLLAKNWPQFVKETKLISRFTWAISIPLLIWLLSLIGFSMIVSFTLSLFIVWFIKNILNE